MKRDERRQLILELLADQGAVEVEELAHRYAVSKMTVHRDLDELEQAGLLRKVRGGATIEAGMQFESDFRFRERQGHEEKELIARRAMELIEPGMTIMINDGSTAAALGEMLPEKRPLTVITNNAAIIDRLRQESGIKLIALGGEYSAKFNGYFGVLTEQSLENLRADIAFISSPAVSGSQAFHMDDDVIRSKRAMLKGSVKSCLLISHQRFGHVALHVLANLEEFDAVITDCSPGDEVFNELTQSGIHLTIAGKEE
ncbi:DeoR family transcriptional regulator [Hahella sp. CCB-MM4]|uniref:DeoR/GlpR family DNA-binding transcription regulator n=1 Tax=Hahella sp. (strain CCB-MM4) TaxID=1926491 RepID=UPI000B9C4E4D|nr:DeoR/GlpR family DNA-binding transcription regulator [Hahella sp. CCB-MM4]OZG73607.1 DeoR family transcriptional regulator [Hahella sp. CCB-MM4]